MKEVAGPNRGQTEVIGSLLLLAMVLVSALGLVAVGQAALEDGTEALDRERIERALTDLRGAAMTAGMAPTGVETLTPTIPAGATWTIRPSIGSIRVNHTLPNGTVQSVFAASLHEIGLDDGASRTILEGGAIMATFEDTAVVREEPPLTARDGIVRLRLLQLTPKNSPATSTALEAPPTTVTLTGRDHDASRTVIRPENGTVTLTIRSPRYRNWARLLARNLPGVVSMSPATQTASVTYSATEGADRGLKELHVMLVPVELEVA